MNASQGLRSPRPVCAPGHPRPPALSDLPSPWTWWGPTLLAILVWSVYSFVSAGQEGVVQLSYGDFLAEARAGAVATVTIDGRSVSGTFKQPVTWPPGAAVTPVFGATTPVSGLAAGSEKPERYTRFTTVMPPSPDEQLLPLLEQHGVTVSNKAAGGASSRLLRRSTCCPCCSCSVPARRAPHSSTPAATT